MPRMMGGGGRGGRGGGKGPMMMGGPFGMLMRGGPMRMIMFPIGMIIFLVVMVIGKGFLQIIGVIGIVLVLLAVAVMFGMNMSRGGGERKAHDDDDYYA